MCVQWTEPRTRALFSVAIGAGNHHSQNEPYGYARMKSSEMTGQGSQRTAVPKSQVQSAPPHQGKGRGAEARHPWAEANVPTWQGGLGACCTDGGVALGDGLQRPVLTGALGQGS
jgi:hypothetical protein